MGGEAEEAGEEGCSGAAAANDVHMDRTEQVEPAVVARIASEPRDLVPEQLQAGYTKGTVRAADDENGEAEEAPSNGEEAAHSDVTAQAHEGRNGMADQARARVQNTYGHMAQVPAEALQMHSESVRPQGELVWAPSVVVGAQMCAAGQEPGRWLPSRHLCSREQCPPPWVHLLGTASARVRLSCPAGLCFPHQRCHQTLFSPFPYLGRGRGLFRGPVRVPVRVPSRVHHPRHHLVEQGRAQRHHAGWERGP